MEIKEAQKQSFEILEKINNKYSVNHDPNLIFLSLIEEIGEVARELSKKQKNTKREDFNKEELADELSDILSRTFVIAEDNNIDMDKAFTDKLNKIKHKFNIK